MSQQQNLNLHIWRQGVRVDAVEFQPSMVAGLGLKEAHADVVARGSVGRYANAFLNQMMCVYESYECGFFAEHVHAVTGSYKVTPTCWLRTMTLGPCQLPLNGGS